MLMFYKAELVFLSIPKTGSTAYQTSLEPFAAVAAKNPPALKHMSLTRYRRFFEPAFEKFTNKKFEIIAVMRDPIDWLGSWYRYRQREWLQGQEKSTHDLSFDEFVQAYLSDQPPSYAKVGSQARFLQPSSNGAPINRLFRYDDQPGLLRFLENRLQTHINIQSVNVSPKRNLNLSPQTLTKLHEARADDFQLWQGIGQNGHYTPLPAWSESSPNRS